MQQVLSNVPSGKSVKLIKIDGSDDQIERLNEMGITTDLKLEVISNRSRKSKQPILIIYRNTQLALSRKISDCLYVESTESNQQ